MATGHHYGPGAVGEQAGARRLVADLLPQGRFAGDRVRPHGERQQRGGAVLSARCATAIANATPCPIDPAVVPPRRRGTYPLRVRTHALGRAGPCSTTPASTPCASMQKHWESACSRDRQRALRRRRRVPDDPGKEARWWRDAALQYFQTFSRQPIPPDATSSRRIRSRIYQRIRCPADPRQAALRRDLLGSARSQHDRISADRQSAVPHCRATPET